MRQFRLMLLGNLLASSCLTIACGSNSSPGQAAVVPRTEIVNTAVSSECGGIGSCCQSKGFAFNAANCDSYLRSKLTADVICPANNIFDAKAAGDCYAATEASFATCGSTSTGMEACSRMCTGTNASGASCTSSRDCAQPSNGTAYCHMSSSGGTGVCSTELRVKSGDPCNETCTDSQDGRSRSCFYSSSGDHTVGTQCFKNDGLYCAADDTCKSLIPLGGACTEKPACQIGSHCNLSTSKCETNLQAGGACPTGDECGDAQYCDANAVCASKKAAGQPCTEFRECQGVCDTTQNHCVDTTSGLPISAAFCSNPASG